MADRTSAVIEWSAAKAVAPGRETIVGIPDDWRRAAGAIERAVEKLKEVPVSDLAAWRGASREAAGLFAAWSRRFERNTPGRWQQRQTHWLDRRRVDQVIQFRCETLWAVFAGSRRSWPSRS